MGYERYTYRANNIKAAYASKLSDPNQVCGTQQYCTIQGSNDWIYRTFLQYDLSGIPSDATIISAKMYVYCNYWNDNGGNGTTNIARVTSEWDEATLCWNKQPGFTGTYLASNVKAPTVNSWGVWDVTSLVNEWHTGAYPNYGLHIKNNNEGSYRVNWDMYNYRYDSVNSNDNDDSNNLGTYILVEYEIYTEKYYKIEESDLVAIADAIRLQKNSTKKYQVKDFAKVIRTLLCLPTGEAEMQATITTSVSASGILPTVYKGVARSNNKITVTSSAEGIVTE